MMTDYEKLVILLNGMFEEIEFTRIKKMGDGLFHLVDRTAEMWVRISGNRAQISFSKEFDQVFEEIEIPGVDE